MGRSDDMIVRNPAPNASPPAAPTGVFREYHAILLSTALLSACSTSPGSPPPRAPPVQTAPAPVAVSPQPRPVVTPMLAPNFASIHDMTDATANGITRDGLPGQNAGNLNSLIAALSADGGGIIWFNDGPIPISQTIYLASHVSFRFTSGAHLKWMGATDVPIVESLKSETLTGFKGDIAVNEGQLYMGEAIRLHSGFGNEFDVLGIGYSKDSTFVHISADSTGGAGVSGDRNFVFNRVRALHFGQCGNFMVLDGVANGVNGNPQVVTLNDFSDCNCIDAVHRGIQIESWADNNTFSGFTRMSVGPTDPNGVGMIINEGNPTVETGVYHTKFENLAVDLFGPKDGRRGVVLGNSKSIHIDMYFQDPVGGGGSFDGRNCQSYWVKMKGDNANDIVIRQKGVTTVNG